jgi:hypothetical protein
MSKKGIGLFGRGVGLVAVLGALINVVQVKYLLPSATMLQDNDFPVMFLNNMRAYTENTPIYRGARVSASIGPLGYVMVLSPSQSDLNFSEFDATASFCEFYQENKAWLDARLLEYGGFVFRGFGTYSAQNFDAVIGSIHDDMKVEVKRAIIS